MKLSAFTLLMFFVAVTLVIGSLIGHFRTVPYLSEYQYWLMTGGFAVLAIVAGCLGSAAAAKDTGMIFVSNEKGGGLTVLDPKTYAIVGTIKTGKRPRGMQFNAD